MSSYLLWFTIKYSKTFSLLYVPSFLRVFNAYVLIFSLLMQLFLSFLGSINISSQTSLLLFLNFYFFSFFTLLWIHWVMINNLPHKMMRVKDDFWHCPNVVLDGLTKVASPQNNFFCHHSYINSLRGLTSWHNWTLWYSMTMCIHLSIGNPGFKGN